MQIPMRFCQGILSSSSFEDKIRYSKYILHYMRFYSLNCDVNVVGKLKHTTSDKQFI